MSDVVVGIHCPVQPDGSFPADGNVAVLVDGAPAFAIAEERVSREKYDGRCGAAAAYAYERLGLRPADVRAVAVSTFGCSDQAGQEEQAIIELAARRAAGDGPRYTVVTSHHLAHAVAAVAQSPFERCLVAVVDNEGSILGPRRHADLWRNRVERTSYYLFEGNSLTLVARDHAGADEVGYGKAYSKVTRYCGFRSYQEAGKTMALAAFGDPSRYAGVPLFVEGADGSERTSMRNSVDGLDDLATFFRESGEVLPPPRRAGEPLEQEHLDLAAWCQRSLEQSVVRRLAGLAGRHGTAAVCGAGGVFLNSVMNRRLQEELGTPDVFVPPSPGDAGLALGAAAWSLWQSTGSMPRLGALPYLGGEYGDAEIRSELRRRQAARSQEVDDPVESAAADLAAGRVVGWFQGRSEYGPRALGNRSILADPSDPWGREVLNHRVKKREWFRPYAPAVAEESAGETFDLRAPVPFMMHVAPVHGGQRARIPGGVHVDGSARLQTVAAGENPIFHRLVTSFAARTGVPALLNTSLNVDGMPIVEAPRDALECLHRAEAMDVLYLGHHRVTRPGSPS